MTVERLDFNRPPLGYHVGPESDYWYWIRGPEGGEGHRGDVAPSEQEVIAAAWAHHKTRHDPPGMRVMGCVEAGAYTIDLDDGTHLAGHWYTSPEQARAAAWAWYEDALEVADLLDDEDIRRVMERVDDGCPLRGDPWCPRVLAWSADQRAEVRDWLADGAVVAGWMPEVLRG